MISNSEENINYDGLVWAAATDIIDRCSGDVDRVPNHYTNFDELVENRYFVGKNGKEELLTDIVDSFIEEPDDFFGDLISDHYIKNVRVCLVNPKNKSVLKSFDYPFCTKREAEIFGLKYRLDNFQKPLLSCGLVNLIKCKSKKFDIDSILGQEENMDKVLSLRPEFDGQEFLVKDGVLLRCFSNKPEVAIPDGVKEIGPYAFSRVFKIFMQPAFKLNNTLNKVVLPDSVLKIDKCAFFNCVALDDVVLSKNLLEIEPKSFYGSKVNELTLPKTIQKVDYDAFVLSCIHKVSIPETFKSDFFVPGCGDEKGVVEIYSVFKQEENHSKVQKNNKLSF